MRKREEVTVEERFVKGDPIKELREEGYGVIKPAWPKYLLVSPLGKLIFAEIKMSGGRLSTKQLSFLNFLKKMEMNTMVIYQKRRVKENAVEEDVKQEEEKMKIEESKQKEMLKYLKGKRKDRSGAGD